MNLPTEMEANFQCRINAMLVTIWRFVLAGITWVLNFPWDWVLPIAVWASMRLLGIEIRFSELRERRYSYRSKVSPKSMLDDATESIEYADKELARAADRKSTIDAKVSGLLKLSALLLPLSIAAVKFASTGSGGLVPLALLGVSLLLMLGYLDIGKGMHPHIDDKDLSLSSAEFKRQHIVSVINSARFNEDVNDFLADVYRASIRAFVASLIALVVVGAINLEKLATTQSLGAKAEAARTIVQPK